jgi:hypothetical protein
VFHLLHFNISPYIPPRPCGRVIAQAVSRWLSTAAAWNRSQVTSCGICGGRSGSGAKVLRVFRCPLPILIPSIVPHSSSLIRGCYNRLIGGRRTRWTQSHPTPRRYKRKPDSSRNSSRSRRMFHCWVSQFSTDEIRYVFHISIGSLNVSQEDMSWIEC